MSSPRRKIVRPLFSEVLYERTNGTFRKLKVALSSSVEDDGGKVYQLDIKGLQHKFDMNLEFTEQDLCFMCLDELQEDQPSDCYLPCFRRRYDNRLVYTRLLMIWFTEDEDGSGKCVKVPFVQKGNEHAALTLLKLQQVIHSNIIQEGDLQYWRVGVIHCGHLYQRALVLLVISKYALVVVYNNTILHHHSFRSCQISVTANKDAGEVKITVTDPSWTNKESHLQNFALTKTYIFQTTQCLQIETCLKSFQRRSTHNPPRPNAHFNIRHSEFSTSDRHPGSTSDNLILPEVCGYDPVNNNTDSSGSGNMSVKIINTPVIDHLPPNPRPHQMGYSESNGQVLSSGSGSITLEKRKRDVPDSLPNLIPRGSETHQGAIEKQPDSPAKPNNNEMNENTGLPSPCKSKVSDNGTFPGTSPLTPVSIFQQHNTFGNEFDCDYTMVKTLFGPDDELPPPPPPCSNLSIPHASFTHKLAEALSHHKPHTETPERLSKLMRSHSFSSVWDEELASHLYINMEQELTFRKLVHGDSQYYRFYINTGYIPFTRMLTKLERRSRLSQEMKEVDFNKLENHENWYDHCYKKRSMDTKYNRLSNRLNIPVGDNESATKTIRRGISTPDDPYWRGDLSLTIQTILQEKPKTCLMLQEIQDCFDLSYEQLVSIQVLLSLVPSENNWKNLAEYIGLEAQDVSIVEHFCYTYNELTTKVLLIHWIRQARKGKCLPSNFENLQRFLQVINRADIMSILQTHHENHLVQTHHEVLESTHF